MTYRFSGFFCGGNETVLKSALVQWPFCKGKLIQDPFVGIGIRCPIAKQKHDVKHELPEFSKNFPTDTFVFIEAECFGGHCDYAGYVVRNGEIEFQSEFEDDDVDILQELLEPLGATLGRRHFFEPFERGYWDRC